jgi:hypothetical protein
VRRIVREAAAQDYRWSAIITAIVHSTPFAMSTGAAPTSIARDGNDTMSREQTR